MFWYDVSSPGVEYTQSRRAYASVVELLHEMAPTWWAAAAKHRLAVALGVAADDIKASTRGEGGYNGSTVAGDDVGTLGGPEMDTLIGTSPFPYMNEGNMDFWTSIGINFESEVVPGIYSIFPDSL